MNVEQANEALASAAADLERARQKRELVNCEKFRAETMRRRANRLQVSREKMGGARPLSSAPADSP